MTELLLVLTSVSLLDSMSVVPLCIVPLSILLAGRQPLFGSLMFVFGIFITYFPFGLLILFGLDSTFDKLGEVASDLWNQTPSDLFLVIQMVIGLMMVVFGFRISARRESHGNRGASVSMTPWQAFVMGVSLNLTGMWGALPYFAAINRVASADAGVAASIMAVGYYNIVFILPLLSFTAIRFLIGKRAETLFDKLTQFSLTWGRRLIIAILIVLGLALIADGIGWFFDAPLLPVSEEVKRQLSDRSPG